MSEQISEEIIARLRVPLPPEAISKHPTKSYLSSIKVIFMIERLNDIFGLGGWKDHYEEVTRQEKIRKGKNGEELYRYQMIVVKGFLSIPQYGIEKQAYGGNDNEDLGDAYKGACTDALSKMCSMIYIGMDVYKGSAIDIDPTEGANLRSGGHIVSGMMKEYQVLETGSILVVGNTRAWMDPLMSHAFDQFIQTIPEDRRELVMRVKQEQGTKKKFWRVVDILKIGKEEPGSAEADEPIEDNVEPLRQALLNRKDAIIVPIEESPPLDFGETKGKRK